jgi:hypothetical protein
MSWFNLFERRLIDALLKSRTFTSSVQKVHSKVHEFQHGTKPNYPHPGGTHLEEEAAKEGAGVGRFMKLFWEELKAGHRPEAKTKDLEKWKGPGNNG